MLVLVACTEAEHKPKKLEDARYEFLETFMNGNAIYTTFRDKQTGHEYLYIDGSYSSSIICLTDKKTISN